ncbi:hypothetical protein, partial [Agrobacterium rosae]|uniref:hypothetical protein n=1 Tax=Agrobacterium rosae TaxID=1972867 RepID=UPI001A8F9A25
TGRLSALDEHIAGNTLYGSVQADQDGPITVGIRNRTSARMSSIIVATTTSSSTVSMLSEEYGGSRL